MPNCSRVIIRPSILRSLALTVLLEMAPALLRGADWTGWRGPEQNGVSRETSLPETWSKDGENVVWRLPHGGRSTPIVLAGRVYLMSRAGSGKSEAERILCLDAETGHIHWEHRLPLFLSDVPSSRLGWASPAGDPETGNVYALGAQGTLLCLDRDGNGVWQRSLHEEFGAITDPGGRASSPIVDGELLIVSFVNSSWGALESTKHRLMALDKRTGQVVWWSEPGDSFHGFTSSVPVAAVVNGVRILVDGNADGGVHAIQARTGVRVWDFKLSGRGINSSVVFWKDRVFACHGAASTDSAAAGRIVCIDATGNGDVTSTHEKWRIDGIRASHASPLAVDGRLYVLDDSARLLTIDCETGKVLHRGSLGRAASGSPVWADGKIYASLADSRFVIVKPEDSGLRTLCATDWAAPDGTVLELNGSPAVSNGRIYFATRDELYCLGFKPWAGSQGAIASLLPEETPDRDEHPVRVQIVPADLVLHPGQSAVLSARLFDARGRFLASSKGSWSVRGIHGAVSETGKLLIGQDSSFGAGAVVVQVDGLAGEARVRVVPTIPFKLDFDGLQDGQAPEGWVGTGNLFLGSTVGSERAVRKSPGDPTRADGEVFFGLPTWKNYTIQADVLCGEARQSLPSLGLINSGYQLMLMGNQERLRIVSWRRQPRVDQVVSFAWKANVWYSMKFRSGVRGDGGWVRAKVWPRDEAEPEKWTLELQDPFPNPGGSPGLQAFSAGVTAKSPGAEAYFDNVQVLSNDGSREERR